MSEDKAFLIYHLRMAITADETLIEDFLLCPNEDKTRWYHNKPSPYGSWMTITDDAEVVKLYPLGTTYDDALLDYTKRVNPKPEPVDALHEDYGEGLLSPDGEYYHVGYANHETVAFVISCHVYNYADGGLDWLFDNGWISIHGGCARNLASATQAQQNFIHEHEIGSWY